MVSVLESDLRDTADLGRKWLIDFNDDILISIVIYCFVWPANNSCAIDVKMNVSLLEENYRLRWYDCLFLLSWIRPQGKSGLFINLILKTSNYLHMEVLNQKISKWVHLSFYQKRFSSYLHLKFEKEVLF